LADIDLSGAHLQYNNDPLYENSEVSKQTLLVVDDYRSNLDAMNALFSLQYRVILHDNAKDAISCATREYIDLILLDIDMPIVNGYDTCAALKKNPITAHIPIIFVTAAGSQAEEAKGLSLGAVDYVSKPVNLTILRARVKNHMKLACYRKKLEVLSCINGLTGASNRRQLDIMLHQHYASATRYGHALSLLRINIDDFKSFNDIYGHAKSAQCLKQVACTIMLMHHIGADIVGRYSGEEFAVILPNTDSAGALIIANKLLCKVRKLNIDHAGNKEHQIVTVSIGLATIKAQPNVRQETGLEGFVKKSGDNLYKAKFMGKNCVYHAAINDAIKQDL
jgi:diguanylate cyclase (GGDEF)-like protein